MLNPLEQYKYKLWDLVGSIAYKIAYSPRHHIWGFKKNDKWVEFWEGLANKSFYKRCDLNDFVYGPSDLAEQSAKQTGYWNLRVALMNFNLTFSDYNLTNDLKYSKETATLIRAIMWPLWMIKYQVRKYEPY